MTSSKIHWELTDKTGRRLGIERRYFSYSCHIPERRCGEDRRDHKDRRPGSDIRLELQFIGVLDEHGEETDQRSILN